MDKDLRCSVTDLIYSHFGYWCDGIAAISSTNAANGGFGGLGLEDLSSVHPAQLSLSSAGGNELSQYLGGSSNNVTAAVIAAVSSHTSSITTNTSPSPRISAAAAAAANNNNIMLSSLSVSGLMQAGSDPGCLFSPGGTASISGGGNGGSSGGGGGVLTEYGGSAGSGGLVGQSDQPDTKDHIEECCPVCGDKVSGRDILQHV